MKTKIKICGIMSLPDAQYAIKTGADFIGFNFVRTSIRHIEQTTALEIISNLDRRRIKIAGVFMGDNPDFIMKTDKLLSLDFVQIHGNISDNSLNRLSEKTITAFNAGEDFDREKLSQDMEKHNSKYFLIDRKIQGRGNKVNFEKAAFLASKFRIFLAGGLTPLNVREAIIKAKPYAVDVAGGVETKGRKDHLKIKNFIEKVKSI